MLSLLAKAFSHVFLVQEFEDMLNIVNPIVQEVVDIAVWHPELNNFLFHQGVIQKSPYLLSRFG